MPGGAARAQGGSFVLDAKPRPELLIWKQVLMLGLPMSINAVPTVAFENVTTFRAHLCGFRRLPCLATTARGHDLSPGCLEGVEEEEMDLWEESQVREDPGDPYKGFNSGFIINSFPDRHCRSSS